MEVKALDGMYVRESLVLENAKNGAQDATWCGVRYVQEGKLNLP